MSSSKTRIQNYLRQNKISELFEEMMGKLIKDLPASPIHYLANLLQEKEKRVKHIMREDNVTSKEKKVEVSSNAMLWATAPVQMKPSSKDKDSTLQQPTSPEVRKYEKPWLTHSKKSPAKSKSGQKLNQTAPVMKSTSKSEKPEWNQKTKISSSTDRLDDVIDGGDQLDLGLVYAKPKVVGEHQVKVKTDEEQIREELSLSGKYKSEESKHDSTANIPSSKKSKKISAKEAKRKRQEELRKLAEESQSETFSKPKSISPITVNNDETDDDAVEILEDADELIQEGVKNPPKTGVIVGRSGQKSKEEIEFVLNMSKFFDELGGMEGLNENKQGSTVEIKFDDDDDFESASQVTGPRRPVWEAPESDVESVVSQLKSARRSDINVESFVSRPAAKKQEESKPEKQKKKSSETSRPRTAPSRSHSNLEANGEHGSGRETYRVLEPKSTKSPRSRPTTPKGSEVGRTSRKLSQASNHSDLAKKSDAAAKDKDKKKKSEPADDVPDTKPKHH